MLNINLKIPKQLIYVYKCVHKNKNTCIYSINFILLLFVIFMIVS